MRRDDRRPAEDVAGLDGEDRDHARAPGPACAGRRGPSGRSRIASVTWPSRVSSVPGSHLTQLARSRRAGQPPLGRGRLRTTRRRGPGPDRVVVREASRASSRRTSPAAAKRSRRGRALRARSAMLRPDGRRPGVPWVAGPVGPVGRRPLPDGPRPGRDGSRGVAAEAPRACATSSARRRLHGPFDDGLADRLRAVADRDDLALQGGPQLVRAEHQHPVDLADLVGDLGERRAAWPSGGPGSRSRWRRAPRPRRRARGGRDPARSRPRRSPRSGRACPWSGRGCVPCMGPPSAPASCPPGAVDRLPLVPKGSPWAPARVTRCPCRADHGSQSLAPAWARHGRRPGAPRRHPGSHGTGLAPAGPLAVTRGSAEHAARTSRDLMRSRIRSQPGPGLAATGRDEGQGSTSPAANASGAGRGTALTGPRAWCISKHRTRDRRVRAFQPDPDERTTGRADHRQSSHTIGRQVAAVHRHLGRREAHLARSALGHARPACRRRAMSRPRPSMRTRSRHRTSSRRSRSSGHPHPLRASGERRRCRSGTSARPDHHRHEPHRRDAPHPHPTPAARSPELTGPAAACAGRPDWQVTEVSGCRRAPPSRGR